MERMRTLLVCLMLLGAAGVAHAKHVRYLGAHPISAKHGGGYCYIEAPHIHSYAPDHLSLYQQTGDELVFTGDPTPFGYDGERHTFYGHHPVVVADAPEPIYCLIDGPHFHAYAPPPGPDFKMKSDVAFYVGAPIPAPRARVRLVNAEERPFAAFRPTVTVEPPPEFHAEVYVPGPPGVEVVAPMPPSVVVEPPHARVEVSAPGVFVEPPHAHVEVRAPGVFIAPPAPPSVTFVAPAPPSAHVVIGAPAPAGVYVEGRGRVVQHTYHYEGHEHHDNGRHNGWHK
jgi:hypothetical protein